MENLALRTKKSLSKESEIQIFNDYIKKIDDLELLLDLIPKALYRPIFNTLTQNYHTSKITAT